MKIPPEKARLLFLSCWQYQTVPTLLGTGIGTSDKFLCFHHILCNCFKWPVRLKGASSSSFCSDLRLCERLPSLLSSALVSVSKKGVNSSFTATFIVRGGKGMLKKSKPVHVLHFESPEEMIYLHSRVYSSNHSCQWFFTKKQNPKQTITYLRVRGSRLNNSPWIQIYYFY